MVHARAAILEEAPDDAVLAVGGEQLDAARAGREQRRLDAVLAEHLAVQESHAEPLAVGGDGRLELGDGDADVVDPLEHASADSTRRCDATPAPGIERPSRSAAH